MYTFCEHFESTFMVAALRIRPNVALVCISLSVPMIHILLYVWVTHVSIDEK